MGIFGLMTSAEHKRLRDASLARLESSIASKDETIDRLVAERDGLKRDLLNEREKFKRAATDLAAQANEITALRPDAMKFRAKAKADAERKRNQRANAKSPAKIAVQGETKDMIDNTPASFGRATGKPRTAIPAKVGKTASAKLSGDRPAKKAAGK